MSVEPQPDPPLAPDELAGTGGEREVLEAFLDFYRGVLVRKASGLSEADARRRLVPSMTTLAGLVKHATGVERGWFQRRWAGRSDAEIGGHVGGREDSWELGEDETVPALVAEYERACEESRRIAAGSALDESVPHPRLGRVSLRWIYVHMIEETARHAGHADILREQIDGATGVDG
ncbi:DinB family protein [Streptomyces sp. 6N223]|uniref:DinB family protein n=1 Tax=Streptomyces sp. 6N223 TaxID=3457412 RepID=UPI003FD6468A